MDEARRLIDGAERARVGKAELAIALGIDRSTLWKYERWPDQAPIGFWTRYRSALLDIGAERQEALLSAVES